jgi:hypothetical protein
MKLGYVARFRTRLSRVPVSLLAGLLLPHLIHASSVELSEVTQHFGKGGTFEFVRRYSVVTGRERRYKGVFEARKFGSWSLTLSLHTWSLDPADSASILPLDVPDDELVGENGVVLKCVDQFRADVPDASVRRVQVDLRVNPILWAGIREEGKSFFKKKGGLLADVKAVDRELTNIFDAFLMQSPVAKAIAESIAARFGQSIQTISCARENWEVSHTGKVGTKLADYADEPALGFSKPVFMNIYLSPK